MYIYIYEVSLFIYWCPRLNGHSGAVGGVVEVCEELPLTFHWGGEGVIRHMGQRQTQQRLAFSFFFFSWRASHAFIRALHYHVITSFFNNVATTTTSSSSSHCLWTLSMEINHFQLQWIPWIHCSEQWTNDQEVKKRAHTPTHIFIYEVALVQFQITCLKDSSRVSHWWTILEKDFDAYPSSCNISWGQG